MTRKVELFIAPSGTACRLLLDGEEMTNCRAVSIRAGVDEATTISFELINVELAIIGEVDGDAITTVDVSSMADGIRRYQVVRG